MKNTIRLLGVITLILCVSLVLPACSSPSGGDSTPLMPSMVGLFTAVDVDNRIPTVSPNNIAQAVSYVNTNPGVYVLAINDDVTASPQTLGTNGVKLTIIGLGGERKISLTGTGKLFHVGGTNGTTDPKDAALTLLFYYYSNSG